MIIPNITSNAAWAALTTPAMCWFNNDPANKYIYGGLYNWPAASLNGGTGIGSIAPTGWHVPTADDFETLLTYLDPTYETTGGKLKESGTLHWMSPNAGATNEVGFTALPAGLRGDLGGLDIGVFTGIGGSCGFWSINTFVDIGITYGSYLMMQYIDAVSYVSGNLRSFGYSIRCLANSTIKTHGQTGAVTDIDGNVYPTICIGTQEWMAQNLGTEHTNDGSIIPPPSTKKDPKKISLYIGTEQVDFADEFNVMFSIGDIRSMQFGNSNKSYTLNLPLTAKNRRLLKYINQPDVKTELNAVGKLYIGELLIFEGKVIITGYQDNYAKILLNSDDWIDALKDKKMTDLDLSAYTHYMTHAAVENTWSPVNSFYRYPMINFGALISTEADVTAKWYPMDFIPMIRVVDLIRMILQPYQVIPGVDELE